MPNLIRSALILGVMIVGTRSQTTRAADESVYELRIYICEPGRLPALEKRFKDHTLKLFEKHGMENVAYWVPIEGEQAQNTLIYILRHKSRAAAKASWDAFRADPDWNRVRAASEEDGKILARAPEAVFLQATDYSGKPGPLAKDKVYELRTYTAAEGKREAMNERFRKHTDKLFAKHGMKSYGYWTPTDEPRSNSELIYVLEHASREAADASWKAFLDDPEWKAVHARSEANGPLVSKIDRVWMKGVAWGPEK